jgi:hypothetical protein
MWKGENEDIIHSLSLGKWMIRKQKVSDWEWGKRTFQIIKYLYF